MRRVAKAPNRTPITSCIIDKVKIIAAQSQISTGFAVLMAYLLNILHALVETYQITSMIKVKLK